MQHTPHSALDADDVRAAYRRWAAIYDVAFGGVSAVARARAVVMVNDLPGERVLEVGVGTGLALKRYRNKRVVGVDLSVEMLSRARARVARDGLAHVEALHEMDAEAMAFDAASFDVAVSMFVASVVPHPRRLIAEMRRVVRPSGHLVFVNHFLAAGGARLWAERRLAPASRALGWHPDFAMEALLDPADRAAATIAPAPPFGLFTLVRLGNAPAA